MTRIEPWVKCPNCKAPALFRSEIADGKIRSRFMGCSKFCEPPMPREEAVRLWDEATGTSSGDGALAYNSCLWVDGVRYRIVD